PPDCAALYTPRRVSTVPARRGFSTQMLRGSSLAIAIVVLTGCSGGDGGIGDSCSDNSDCTNAAQRLNSVCGPRRHRRPHCGDGYSCDKEGLCHLSVGALGERCESEVDCGPGLSCQINGSEVDASGHLVAQCTDSNQVSARPSGSTCDADEDCVDG